MFNEEFNRLSTLIKNKKGSSFVIALYNEPNLPEDTFFKLKNELPSFSFHKVTFTPILLNPLEGIKHINKSTPSCIFFYDIPKHKEALELLNLFRDELAEYNACFVLWTDDSGYKNILQKAPDFSSRCITYDFKMPTPECGILCLIDLVDFSYRIGLKEEHYPLLKRVHQEKMIINEPLFQELLHNIALLEYRNKNVWADVHPIVLPLVK